MEGCVGEPPSSLPGAHLRMHLRSGGFGLLTRLARAFAARRSRTASLSGSFAAKLEALSQNSPQPQT